MGKSLKVIAGREKEHQREARLLKHLYFIGAVGSDVRHTLGFGGSTKPTVADTD